MTGIYFLIFNGSVVYVGQSVQLEKRIKCHKDKEHDSIRIIECESNKLSIYESRWIKMFMPKYNVHMNRKKSQHSINLKNSLWTKIEKQAEKDSRSINNLVEKTLEEKFL